jgi:hypothetical protein
MNQETIVTALYNRSTYQLLLYVEQVSGLMVRTYIHNGKIDLHHVFESSEQINMNLGFKEHEAIVVVKKWYEEYFVTVNKSMNVVNKKKFKLIHNHIVNVEQVYIPK